MSIILFIIGAIVGVWLGILLWNIIEVADDLFKTVKDNRRVSADKEKEWQYQSQRTLLLTKAHNSK